MSEQTKKGSIEGLRIYQLALSQEEKVYKLVSGVPQSHFELANNLRRASAGVAHHIFESHRRYSYSTKMDELHAARQEAELAIKLLPDLEAAGFGKVATLCEDYTTLVKQSWGLIKWFKARVGEKQASEEVQAKDQLVAARG